MNMIEVKTSELIGPALDWAVAQVEGKRVTPLKTGLIFGVECGHPCRYSSSWAQCGPLIEKHRIWLGAPYGNRHCWNANYQICSDQQDGETPLIAACRAIVAAHSGDVVSVPAELVKRPA